MKDICSNEQISNGTNILATLAENALVNVEVTTEKPLVTLNNANVTNTTNVLNYTDAQRNISAPSGKRIVTEFEIKTNLTQFSNITVMFNYTSFEAGLDDETSIVMYKCPSLDSCSASSWSQLTSALNTTTNTVSATVTSLSLFLIAETPTSTTTVTQTVTQTVSSSGGGGGSGGGGAISVPQIVRLDLLLPQPLTMYLNDSLMAPVIIRNSGETAIRNVTLEGIIQSEYLNITLNSTYFEKLGVNESVTVMAVLKSFAPESGNTEITFTAIGQSPSAQATGKMYIELIEKDKGNKSAVFEKVKFLADLFNNNPECLELNELLRQAQEASDLGQYGKAMALTESAINSCRQLLSYKKENRTVIEKPKQPFKFRLSLPLIIVILLILAALAFYYLKNSNISMPKARFNWPRKNKTMPKKSSQSRNEEEDINKMLKRKL